MKVVLRKSRVSSNVVLGAMDKYVIQNNDSSVPSNVPQSINIPDLGKSLLNASRNGDVEEVRSLLNNGAPFATDWVLAFSSHKTFLSTLQRFRKYE